MATKSVENIRQGLSQQEALVLSRLAGQGKTIITLEDVQDVGDLSYERARGLASNLVKKQWLDRLKPGLYLVVPLEAGETGSFQPVSVHTRQPEGLSIQGRVFHAGSGGIGRSGPVMSVRYNLERYFASPEDALALEELRNESRLRLIVSVGSDGSAIIRGLEIDGEDHIDRLF